MFLAADEKYLLKIPRGPEYDVKRLTCYLTTLFEL